MLENCSEAIRKKQTLQRQQQEKIAHVLLPSRTDHRFNPLRHGFWILIQANCQYHVRQ